MRQLKTLSHVSFCPYARPAAQCNSPHFTASAALIDYSRTDSWEFRGLFVCLFFLPQWDKCWVGRLQIHSFCQMLRLSLRCLMFSQKSLNETSHWGAQHCPHVGFFNMTRPSLVLFATHCLFNHDGLLWREPQGKIRHLWNVFVHLRNWQVPTGAIPS